MRDSKMTVRNLHRGMCLAAQLPYRFDHPDHAATTAGMIIAKAAAIRVHRQLAFLGNQRAVMDEASALTRGAEAEILQVYQHSNGESVIKRGVLNLSRFYACLGKGFSAGTNAC